MARTKRELAESEKLAMQNVCQHANEMAYAERERQ